MTIPIPMHINADFSLPVIVTPEQHRWVASPQGGVERMMLDRVGVEQARATSLVRYLPGARFPRHAHPDGEEILVLSGTFADETGTYPAGIYLRNPPDSSHQPFSEEGALIFVKLRQMAPGDVQEVRIDTRDPAAWQGDDGRMVCPLFASPFEQVSLQRLDPGQAIPQAPGGAELLVLAGSLRVRGQEVGVGGWLRLPRGERPPLHAGEQGATCYLKTGHR